MRVLPAATPVMVPVLFTLAMAAFAVVHVPPVTPGVRAVVPPMQISVVPVRLPGDGNGVTVML